MHQNSVPGSTTQRVTVPWPQSEAIHVTAHDVNCKNPQNRGFSEFLAILGCNTHFKSKLRQNRSR